jgi:alpha-ketoglutarate-dependent taurine dioxygenase
VNDLVAHAVQPDAIYRHQWTPGDMLIWDERSTIHRGEGDYTPTARRIMLRAIIDQISIHE